MSEHTKRQPAGIPVGGQFAANEHDEAASTLSSVSILDEYTFKETPNGLDMVYPGGHEYRFATPEIEREYRAAIAALSPEARREYAVRSALAQWHGTHLSEVSRVDGAEHYGLPVYSVGDETWAVGSDEQASLAAENHALDTIWTNHPKFLSEHTGIDEEAFAAIQSRMEDRANDSLQKIVDATWNGGLSGYARAALSGANPRGELSPYDGDEKRVTVTVGDEDDMIVMYRQG